MTSYRTSFFYDRQIRRFLQQFIRILSNFQVELGSGPNGEQVLQTVPVFYGDASRQASQILRSNSENAIKSVPAMAVHINALNYDQKRTQEPNFVSTINVRTQGVDPVTGAPNGKQGDTFTVERLMPVPYRLTLKVDVWTSNTEQKLMLLEQIMVLFNPAFEIQSTDNYIDWTSLSYVLLTGIDWSNRSVPAGTEDTIDIASLTFELPIWISPPAKIKKLGVIQAIVNSIFDTQGQLTDLSIGSLSNNGLNDPGGATANWTGVRGASTLDLLTQKVITFSNYSVVYHGNTLKLARENDITATDVTLSPDINLRMRHQWAALIQEYGAIVNGSTQIRLLQANGSEVVGVIALHPTDDSLLLYTPFGDTLPANTIDAINAIINPQNVNVDTHLANLNAGTRYLLLHAVGNTDDTESAPAWNYAGYPTLVAEANDIIEFNGNYWTVVFAAAAATSVEYVTNLTTGSQYKWEAGAWTKSVEGVYLAADWRLVL
jgi:hypothetical protein